MPSHRRVWLAVLAVSASYAALRLAMNQEFAGAPWDALLGFSAAKPFGLRVLVPVLAWPLQHLLRVPTTWVLGLFETLATAGLIWALAAAVRPWTGARGAMVAALGFVAMLPWAFLLGHRWPIFYPYDTPAMAFTAAGIFLVVQQRWRAAMVLAAVAAVNRETALLLPAAAVAIALAPPAEGCPAAPPRRQLWRNIAALTAIVVGVRTVIGLVLHANPGAPLQFFVDGQLRFLDNLAWLETPVHWLYLPAYFGFLPLAWLLLPIWDLCPRPLANLGWVALAYFAALLWVANIDEPRVYGEIWVLLYIPVAAAVAVWLRQPPDTTTPAA